MANATQTPSLSEMEQRLIEINRTLGTWNGWVSEARVPADLAPALITGGMELLKLAKPAAKTAEEVAVLYELIAVLVKTNQALRQHASFVAELARQAKGSAWHAYQSLDKLNCFANFREPSEEEDE